MITTINNKHKKLNFSSEREQSQACLNSAEHEKNQGRKVLNVPNLRFPEFEEEWEKQKLCDISSIVGRIGFRGYATNDIVEKGMGAIALSPTNIVNNQLTYDKDNTYISMSKYEESPEIMIKRGDVIFVKTGSTVGKVAYVDKMICKTTLNPQVVVLKDIKCDNYILSVIMSTRNFQNKIQRITVGGAVPTLSQVAMGNIFISLPAAKEQEKISKFISLLDERITTQNKIIEDLKKLKSAIIDYAINSLNTDFAKFGSLYEMAGEGGTPTTSNASFYDNGKIPFIKIDDLKQKYLTENKDFITELGLQKSSAWLVPTRSILFSNGATIGEITITTYPVCTKQGILGIVPKQNIDVEFLYYFMSSSYFKKAVSRIVTEGTMKTAYLKDINNILCPIPTKEKQQEIAEMPSALNSKIDFEQSILKLFCSQKQHLLRQMFI